MTRRSFTDEAREWTDAALPEASVPIGDGVSISRAVTAGGEVTLYYGADPVACIDVTPGETAQQIGDRLVAAMQGGTTKGAGDG